jgi:hypothetical protein
MTEHTKTPWETYGDINIQSVDGHLHVGSFGLNIKGTCDGFYIGQANAHFIVTACNHHDELVAALKRIASGEGYYGAQAAEYKQIARDVLSELEAEDAK